MDHVDKMKLELDAIAKLTEVLQTLPDDATRRRVLTYVRQKVVPSKKRGSGE